jgi:hypothetical protein
MYVCVAAVSVTQQEYSSTGGGGQGGQPAPLPCWFILCCTPALHVKLNKNNTKVSKWAAVLGTDRMTAAEHAR